MPHEMSSTFLERSTFRPLSVLVMSPPRSRFPQAAPLALVPERRAKSALATSAPLMVVTRVWIAPYNVIHLRKVGACPVLFLVEIARLSAAPRGIFGVWLFTRLLGRQYSTEPPAPQGLRVILSVQRSRCHRRRLLPAALLRTCPDRLRHLATACAARADHFPYDCITRL